MASIMIDTQPEPNTEPNTEKCNICQEDISNNKVKTPCEHEFCSDCFFKWMQEKPNCPLCRTEFVNQNIMADINANREELSVITSEVTYLKVRASKLKKQARKMYIKSEMSWERQIRLRDMLETTREEIILERKRLRNLRKKTKKTKNINMLYNKEDKETNDILDYIDGYCTAPIEMIHNYSEGETKEDTNELCETVWNNMLLETPVETPVETPETNSPFYSTDEDGYYDEETDEETDEGVENLEFNLSTEWYTHLNDPLLISNDETVIFTFGEN